MKRTPITSLDFFYRESSNKVFKKDIYVIDKLFENVDEGARDFLTREWFIAKTIRVDSSTHPNTIRMLESGYLRELDVGKEFFVYSFHSKKLFRREVYESINLERMNELINLKVLCH